MRNKPHPYVEKYRLRTGQYGTEPGLRYGAFSVDLPGGVMFIIASDGSEEIPWEHVSCSFKDRLPTWDEMCVVKGFFWDDEECVVQFHPPKSQYVNNHRNCLHLWKPWGKPIQTPPTIALGIK